MEKKFRLTLLATTMSLVLSACSSDDSETTEPTTPVENAVPVIQITSEKQVTMDEREEVVITYNVLDSDDAESSLEVFYEVSDNDGIKGNISLDTTNKTLTYAVGNIQDDENFSIVLDVRDPKGATATDDSLSERTVTISVSNSYNEAPEILTSGLDVDSDGNALVTIKANTGNNGEHSMTIPFSYEDADGDEVELSLSSLSGINGDVKFNDDKSAIILEADEVYTDSVEGNFTLSVSDGAIETNLNFIVTLEATQVAPELEITKNKNERGEVVPFEVNEGEQLIINFTKEDKNGDDIFVQAELSEEVATFDTNVSGNSITLNNFVVEEDMTVTLTLTATDATGTADSVDTVEINVTACADCAYNDLSARKDTLLTTFNSLDGRRDEIKLGDFYTDYLSLTDQVTDLQVEVFKTNILNGLDTDKNSIESQLTVINQEFEKAEEDESLKIDSAFVENLQSLMTTFENSVNEYGNSAIIYLNQMAQIDSKLPIINTAVKVNAISETEFSRYVGNSEFGYYKTEFVWVFVSDYSVFEVVNILSGECN